jgi:hypothetical protein
MEQTSQPQTKVCARCHQERPVSEFAVSNKSADGLQSWCRSCYRQNYIEKEKLGGGRVRSLNSNLASLSKNCVNADIRAN